MKLLSPWIQIEHCATRVLAGTDPAIVANRYAFIEKTPRVRTDRIGVSLEADQIGCRSTPYGGWISGYKGSDGNDPESRKWCDDMLRLLGYMLEDDYPMQYIPLIKPLLAERMDVALVPFSDGYWYIRITVDGGTFLTLRPDGEVLNHDETIILSGDEQILQTVEKITRFWEETHKSE